MFDLGWVVGSGICVYRGKVLVWGRQIHGGVKRAKQFNKIEEERSNARQGN